MSSSATLALGQASYTLLDVLGDDGAKVASLSKRGSTETLSAVKRGGEISDIGITGDGLTTLNVADRSSRLFYADDGEVVDGVTSNFEYDSKINLLAGSSFSTFELGDGDNRFNAARDLTDSEVTAHEGDDTIRIGGSADGSFVSTGDGDDHFTANRGSEGLDVAMGEGDDTALFLGTLTAGPNLVTPTEYNVEWYNFEYDGEYTSFTMEDYFVINGAKNIVDMGDGDDSATFLGGVRGDTPITFTVHDLFDLYGITVSGSNPIITTVTSGAGGKVHLNEDGTVTFTPIATNGVADFGFTYSYTDDYDQLQFGYSTVEASPHTSGYEIQLGAGYDTVVFGANSTSDGFVLNTGTGSDMVTLGRITTNAVIDLGWDNGGNGDIQYNENSGLDDNFDLGYEQGDLVVLGVGATLTDSLIRSGQSNDLLFLTGTVTDSTLDLGWGNADVDVSGAVGFGDDTDALWDLGGGNDTLTFREYSDISLLGNESYGYFDLGTGADSLSLLGTGFGEWGAIEFDLGDDSDIDTIEFVLDPAYSGLLINNFGDEDILIIGDSEYGYEDLFGSGGGGDDLSTFLAAGNEIRSVYSDNS